MWSGRFAGGQDAVFAEWQRSFPFDRRLLPYEISASRVYARALHRAGVLSQAELEALLRALQQVLAAHGAQPEDDEAEDVHHFVEMRLVKLIGPAATRLHTGRSRNEQVATDLRLLVRDAGESIAAALETLMAALLERAEEAGDAAMPGYTHLQPAEPVLVAHWLLAYAQMFRRDADRLQDCMKRVNVCPLGSGALAGSTVALDRHFIAAELGFSGPTANSLDAVSDRDFALEYLQVLSQIALHLSRWAEEFTLFASQEFGYVRLPEAYSTGSSAMPQKQNPDALELIRAATGRVFGAAAAVFVVGKGLPLAYNKDLQETQRPIYEAGDAVEPALAVAAGFLREVRFDWERMHAQADAGFMNAMAGAAYLAARGVPFRQAHEQMARAVRLCLERGCGLRDLALGDLRAIGSAFDQDFYAAIELPAVLALHDVYGGTAPAQVRAAIAAARAQLKVSHAHA